MPVCKCCKRWFDPDEHEDDYGNDAPQDLCPQCLFDTSNTFEDPEDGEIRVDDEEFEDDELQNDPELEEYGFEGDDELDDEGAYDDLVENDNDYA